MHIGRRQSLGLLLASLAAGALASCGVRSAAPSAGARRPSVLVLGAGLAGLSAARAPDSTCASVSS